jgi:hypothetical protein
MPAPQGPPALPLPLSWFSSRWVVDILCRSLADWLTEACADHTELSIGPCMACMHDEPVWCLHRRAVILLVIALQQHLLPCSTYDCQDDDLQC